MHPRRYRRCRAPRLSTYTQDDDAIKVIRPSLAGVEGPAWTRPPARIIKDSLSKEFWCIVEPEFAASQRDPRLAAQLADLATGATPAWLWSADGSQILWANAVGAAIFGAANTSQAVGRRITLHHPAAGEIARLAV